MKTKLFEHKYFSILIVCAFVLCSFVSALTTRSVYIRRFSKELPEISILGAGGSGIPLYLISGGPTPHKLLAINTADEYQALIRQWSFDYTYRSLDSIVPSTRRQLNPDIIAISYIIDGAKQTAYAYFLPSKPADGIEAKCNVVVQPGSGLDESYHLFKRNTSQQSHLIPQDKRNCNYYIMITKGEDALSVRYRTGRVAPLQLYSTLLNRKASLSSLQLADNIAVSRFLKQSSTLPVLQVGFSKGGVIAFLSSKFSFPAKAFIFSGWSQTFLNSEYANVNQFISFHANDLYKVRPSALTVYKFFYGKEEGDVYGWESSSRFTCKSLHVFTKVVCKIHDGAHVVPSVNIEDL